MSLRSSRTIRRALRARWLALSLATLALVAAAAGHSADPVIVVAGMVRDSLNGVWSQANVHWNEIADQNMLAQALGTGKPTQKEYLGCLIGEGGGDTLRVTAWVPAHDMKRLQFAVTGNCDSVPGVIGTFHTHPYRADPAGKALKEPGLSVQDLATFTAGADRVLIVVWDVDSLDIALRARDGRVVHPAILLPH
jgi:hypothetical protein